MRKVCIFFTVIFFVSVVFSQEIQWKVIDDAILYEYNVANAPQSEQVKKNDIVIGKYKRSFFQPRLNEIGDVYYCNCCWCCIVLSDILYFKAILQTDILCFKRRQIIIKNLTALPNQVGRFFEFILT